MKKTWRLVVLISGLTISTFAQDGPEPKFELSVSGGWGVLTSFRGGTTHSDVWSYQYLQSVRENTAITAKVKSSAFVTAAFSYFFGPNLGLQLGAGYIMPKVTTDGTFNFSYQWTTRSTIYNESAANSKIPWGGGGKSRTVPLFVNVVGKCRLGMIDLFATAGPSLYFNSYEANSFMGFGDTSSFTLLIPPYLFEFQDVDAFKIPARIPRTSWTAFGASFGARLDCRISPIVAVTVEGRYFLVPKKSLAWQWEPGTYDSIFYNNFAGWTYTADDLASAQAKTAASKVNLSFFSVSLGFKIGFGSK